MTWKNTYLLLLAASLIAFGGVIFSSVQSWISVREAFNELNNSYLPVMGSASEVSLDILAARMELFRYQNSYEPTPYRSHEHLKQARENLMWISQHPLPENITALSQSLLDNMEQFQKMIDRLKMLIEKDDSLKSSIVYNELAGSGTALSAISDNLKDSLQNYVIRANKELQKKLLRTNTILTGIAIIVLALLVCGVIFQNWFLNNEVNEKTSELRNRLHDLHKSEKALQESEEKYRGLFEYSRDAIMLMDAEKGYLDCNPAALELFAIKSKEQLSELKPSILSPEYQPDGSLSANKANQMVRKAIEKGSHLFEWTHKRLNGEEFQAMILATKFKWGDRMILQGTIRDISEYKKTQELMIQTEKMMSVGGLAAGMAHEINNPLAGVMQTAHVVSNRLNNLEMSANQRAAEEVGIDLKDIKAYMEKRGILRMITDINKSGLRVAEIVDNMLSFARKNDTQSYTHFLSELIEKTLELAATDYDLKKHYDFKMIKIEKDYDNSMPSVPCEGTQIQQVLLNILRNGAQAMQEAGIQNPRFIVRTRLEKERKMACMEIEDNGPGMDESIRKRIFEPFYTTKPVGVGTGLGLSVSYFIITENHRGEMTVKSEIGYGAKFIIRLPIERKASIPKT